MTLDSTVYLSHMGYVISSRSSILFKVVKYDPKKKTSSDSHLCPSIIHISIETNAYVLHAKSEAHHGLFIEMHS